MGPGWSYPWFAAFRSGPRGGAGPLVSAPQVCKFSIHSRPWVRERGRLLVSRALGALGGGRGSPSAPPAFRLG